MTLVVYSAQGYDHAMTTAFQKATGIPVKLDDNSTGPLLTQIEASKNNPNRGLLWVDGATAFAGMMNYLGGVSKGESYFTQLKSNGLLLYEPGSPPASVAIEDNLDLPRLGRLTGVFAEMRAARGEVVGLRLEPGGCHVFAEPADGAEPPAGRPDTAGITSLNRQ